jgi:hypothetical protein
MKTDGPVHATIMARADVYQTSSLTRLDLNVDVTMTMTMTLTLTSFPRFPRFPLRSLLGPYIYIHLFNCRLHPPQCKTTSVYTSDQLPTKRASARNLHHTTIFYAAK